MMRRVTWAIGLALVLSGCTQPTANVQLDGTLTVLEPRHDFVTREFPKNWTVIGKAGGFSPAVRHGEGRLFLEVAGGRNQVAAMRRLDAQLLATPFLAWRWRFSETPSKPPPMQLTVGFLDSRAPSRSFSLARIWGSELPKFTRSLTIAWGRSALQRGTLEMLPGAKGKPSVARYYTRGGRENLGRWWSETIDLSALHAKAWPGVDMRGTRIVFAGLVMMKNAIGSHAHIAELRLSR